MDPIQAIIDAALAMVRHQRGELLASGDADDPLGAAGAGGRGV